MRILGGLGSIAIGATFAVIFLVVNGGYIYRTKCPLPSSGTQTKWTYGIDDLLPYIRSTSPPCKSHTGTRLLLSAIGIAPLHTGGSTADATPITPADETAAEALATAVSAITTGTTGSGEWSPRSKRQSSLRGSRQTYSRCTPDLPERPSGDSLR